MPGYYAQFPTSPFSSAAKGNQVRAPKAKKAQRPPRTHAKVGKSSQHSPAPSPRWGPNGPVAHAAIAAPPTYDLRDNVMFLLAENLRLNAETATMGGTHYGRKPQLGRPLTPTSLLTTGHANSTAGSMGLATPTMDVTAKWWAPIRSTRSR
jgi:hypothetical protein